MYRKEVKMANIQSSGLAESEFLHQVRSIHAFKVSLNIVLDVYKSMKSSNRFVSYTLNTAEKAIMPIITKLEKPIKTMDHLAGKGLESLGGCISLIIKPPQLVGNCIKHIYIVTRTKVKNKYEDVKVYSISKVNIMTDQGIQKSEYFLSSPYGISFFNCLDSAFDSIELYLDYFLPPLGDDGPQKSFGDKEKLSTMKRADVLSKRFEERFYKHSLLKIQKLQIRCRKLCTKTNKLNLLVMQYLRRKRV